MAVRVIHDDCMAAMAMLAAEGVMVDSVVTDPPYHLSSIVKRFGGADAAPAMVGATGAYARAATGFMGKQWDGGDIAFRPETWAAVLAIMKPGAHLVAFSGSRTYHRMACAIEDAGFEIRDQIMWLYGSGFPKSHDVSKGIDKHLGAERTKVRRPAAQVGNFKGRADTRQWQGWGTALKPAHEPIVLARKPLIGTVAANVMAHGTGAINIDGCRIEGEPWSRDNTTGENKMADGWGMKPNLKLNETGVRWPANVVHDGSDEVVAAFPVTAAGVFPASRGVGGIGNDGHRGQSDLQAAKTDSGSAARFFYSSKADAGDRCGSKHPTVKPTDLMAYLERLITPPGGLVLDPFAGSGSTGMAAMREGFDAILIEREAEYIADIRRRLDHVAGLDSPLFGAGQG